MAKHGIERRRMGMRRLRDDSAQSTPLLGEALRKTPEA
jgi:hypothetical protein